MRLEFGFGPKLFRRFVLGLGLSTLGSTFGWSGEIVWSKSAHEFLIYTAFPHESPLCLRAMSLGSQWVDRVEAQFDSSWAPMHAMRAADQSIEEAQAQMESFIQECYRNARAAQATMVRCFWRGAGLHPIMDSTSPAHHGYQVWRVSDFWRHGDMPGSRETLSELRADRERERYTLDLMVERDKRELGD